ncbi:MAG: PorT family protein [Bacteroidetes bacterium]|nr:PorT family protein [Bacteroidota bacterium]
MTSGRIPVFLAIALSFLMCGFFQPLRAQNTYFSDEYHTFYGGLVLGANFTQVDGDTYEGYHKVGFNVGGIVYMKISQDMGISMEMLYTQKGSHDRSQSESPYIGPYFSEYKLKLNYVEVPVLFHFLTSRRLHYELGAAYAQLINSSESLFSDPGMVIDPNIYSFRKSDISVLAGGSYQIYKWWFLEARFQYSLATIRDANRIPFGGPQQFNNVVTLRLVRFLNKTDN